MLSSGVKHMLVGSRFDVGIIRSSIDSLPKMLSLLKKKCHRPPSISFFVKHVASILLHAVKLLIALWGRGATMSKHKRINALSLCQWIWCATQKKNMHTHNWQQKWSVNLYNKICTPANRLIFTYQQAAFDIYVLV